MPSSLTFSSTEQFRNRLIARNLTPYTVPGIYSPPSGPPIYEITLSDSSVINSPDELISDNPFVDLAYPLNSYGPNGGYDDAIGINNLQISQPNQGPYGYQNTKLEQLSQQYENLIPGNSTYSNGGPLQLYSVDNDIFNGNPNANPTFQPYYEPWSFTPSTYSPYQILLQDNPTGDNGSLSSDSYIAQLGAKTLKREFQERIARNVYRNTLGRVNLDDAFNDPVKATQVLTGQLPLIERDWVITRPSNPVVWAADFALRLGGTYFPASEIPGDYFEDTEGKLSTFGQISKAFNGGKDPRGGAFGKVFGRLLTQKSPSQLFLNNTGGGQKSQLFYNLSYNRYGPNYNRSILGDAIRGIANGITNLFTSGDRPTVGGYYVGSKELPPSRIDSPSGEVPVDPFGKDTQAIVYGPDKMAKDFETDSMTYKIGLAGKSLTDGGGISGGLVWTSPKYKNPGYSATIGGAQGAKKSNTDAEQAKVVSDEMLTDTHEFKQSSILDNTQRLLDSTPDGGKRLSHVGNAINQLSKVFHDGYKEITKGSKVIKYQDGTGVQVGTEYGRVFTKDTPYYTYGDLQKKDGNIRKFGYSVLDNTYNLNIAPMKSTSKAGSTNIQNGRVKKYMFSIENLAWRTGNRPGFSVVDLPECEIGPNGGRIMWFPPYDIKFSETVTPSFEEKDFLGRPEPIYTYKNTKRSGRLSWSIVVDHPSIINLIVNKELNSMSDDQINSLVDSFFAGCKKYDLYELAKKYNTLSRTELSDIQHEVNMLIQRGAVNQESAAQIISENPKNTPQVAGPNNQPSSSNLNNWIGIGYYFDDRGVKSNYTNEYNDYISRTSSYKGRGPTQADKDSIEAFMTQVITYNYSESDKMLNEIFKILDGNRDKDGKTRADIQVVLVGTSDERNLTRTSSEVSSVQNYMESWNGGKLKKFITRDKKLKIVNGTSKDGSVENTVYGKTSTSSLGPFDCVNIPSNSTFDKTYSPRAMACRRVVIKSINVTVEPDSQNKGADTTKNSDVNATPAGLKTGPPSAPSKSINESFKEGVTKKILKSLLSECSYFEMINESNPMFYASMKDKLKHFSPAFHSITPEGLNSRLTFLQQCTRPGDTIPVIGVNGEAKYTSAINTSFGAPPVLVLRIGDFYNTKIIPTSLGISYEPLVFDLNPEGIGVQPMIARIDLSFNFVGGSGLKDPIDKLQNALSFNFYANTEMYDDRADITDHSLKKLDQEIWDSLADTISSGVNNVDNQSTNESGNPIGTVLTQQDTASGATGTISYKNIMDSLVKNGQSYFDTVSSKLEQINTSYNLTVANIATQNRNYSKGDAKEFTARTPVKIFGKPENYTKVLDKLYDQVIKDIDKSDKNSGNDYIKTLYVNNFDSRTIKKVKENLKKEVTKARDDISNGLNSIVNDIVKSELDLVKNMRKIDIVLTRTDGYIRPDKNVEIYNLTATTEVGQSTISYSDTLSEMDGDYDFAVTDIDKFFDDLVSGGIINDNLNFSSLKKSEYAGLITPDCCEQEEIRFYIIMSNTFLDSGKYNNFIENLIPTDLRTTSTSSGGSTLYGFTQMYMNNKQEDFKIEHDGEVAKFNSVKTTNLVNYTNWKPYVSGKERKFNFSGEVDGTNTQIKYLKDLYMDGNSNTNKSTFNGKNKFN